MLRVASFDHAADPVCANCGRAVYFDYDGEAWHEGEELPPRPKWPEPEPELSFQEQKAAYLAAKANGHSKPQS